MATVKSLKADVWSVSRSSERMDEGLTLKTSAFKPFSMANLSYQLSKQYLITLSTKGLSWVRIDQPGTNLPADFLEIFPHFHDSVCLFLLLPKSILFSFNSIEDMKAEMQINQENNFTRKILNHIAPSLFISIIPTSLI